MKKPRSGRNGKATCTLADIAQSAGVTKATVSYALRNSRKVSPDRRKKIQDIARRLGYMPDARLSSVMTAVRKTREKTLLPIAWINNHQDGEHVWKQLPFLSPYYNGARRRAEELGYFLEDIWTHEKGMTSRRLSDILYHRGIQGVVVTQYLRHLRLNWDHMASVAIHGQLVSPRISHVMPDLVHNLYTALKTLKRMGFRRIGICLERAATSYAYITLQPFVHFHSKQVPAKERVPPLFYSWGPAEEVYAGEKQIRAWIKRHRPEVLIGHSDYLCRWAEQAGIKVPEEMGVVHLATDDDVKDWAGIHSNREAVGAAAIEYLAARIQNHDFGLPAYPKDILIRGEWHMGKTLRPRR